MAEGSYKQFCPVAMAAETLCTRWTIVLLRELVAGSTRFNDLRRGVPRMSPALLSKRLRDLESAGIVERRPVPSEPEIYEYEPHMALDGGEDGLQWIRHIIFHAPRYLKPGGILILAIGHDQMEAIEKIIAPLAWYKQVNFIMDYSGHRRIVQLQKKDRF